MIDEDVLYIIAEVDSLYLCLITINTKLKFACAITVIN